MGNHYLLLYIIGGFIQYSAGISIAKSFGGINDYQLTISNGIISLLGGYPWEIITYHCDIIGSFIQYLVGISIAKSLLTVVISMVVSFNTWQGFHCKIITYCCDINSRFIQYLAGISITKSIFINSQFQNEIITYLCCINSSFIQYSPVISIVKSLLGTRGWHG